MVDLQHLPVSEVVSVPSGSLDIIARRTSAQDVAASRTVRVTTCLDAYGIPVQVRSDSNVALDLVADALPFQEVPGPPVADKLIIDLNFSKNVDALPWLDTAEVVRASDDGQYLLCRIQDDPLVSLANIGLARYLSAERRIQVIASPRAETDRYLLTQALLSPVIPPALRSWGLLALHACAVDWQGRAIIFPAASGSGKSTLALALLRAGFRLLSDDSPILRRQTDGTFKLLAYPEPLRLLPDALARFPETRRLETEPSGQKRLLDPVSIYPDPYVEESTPALIVMPQIAHGEKSVLRPASAGQALTELVSGVAFGSTGGTMLRDFPVLAQFVRSCRVYSLETGTDFDRLPVLLRALLESE